MKMENNFEHITLAIALLPFALWLIILVVLQFSSRRSDELQLTKPKRDIGRIDNSRDIDLADVSLEHYYRKHMGRNPSLPSYGTVRAAPFKL